MQVGASERSWTSWAKTWAKVGAQGQSHRQAPRSVAHPASIRSPSEPLPPRAGWIERPGRSAKLDQSVFGHASLLSSEWEEVGAQKTKDSTWCLMVEKT